MPGMGSMTMSNGSAMTMNPEDAAGIVASRVEKSGLKEGEYHLSASLSHSNQQWAYVKVSITSVANAHAKDQIAFVEMPRMTWLIQTIVPSSIQCGDARLAAIPKSVLAEAIPRCGPSRS